MHLHEQISSQVLLHWSNLCRVVALRKSFSGCPYVKVHGLTGFTFRNLQALFAFLNFFSKGLLQFAQSCNLGRFFIFDSTRARREVTKVKVFTMFASRKALAQFSKICTTAPVKFVVSNFSKKNLYLILQASVLQDYNVITNSNARRGAYYNIDMLMQLKW